MDPFFAGLLSTVINVYLVFLLIRIFMTESERYDQIFDIICKATDPVLTPFGANLRSRQLNLAPLVPMAVLLLVKGLIRQSIPGSLLGFADFLLQMYVMILIIISGFREYYTNPIANFAQRMVNPVRAVMANFSRQVGTVNLLSVLFLLIAHIILTVILTSFMAASLPLKPAIIGSLHLILTLANYFALIIFINILLSWVSPDPRNPIVQLLALVSYPILEPIRRVVPPLGMFDLSAIIAIFGLQIVYGIGHSILSSL
jgi:YggT family protein